MRRRWRPRERREPLSAAMLASLATGRFQDHADWDSFQLWGKWNRRRRDPSVYVELADLWPRHRLEIEAVTPPGARPWIAAAIAGSFDDDYAVSYLAVHLSPNGGQHAMAQKQTGSVARPVPNSPTSDRTPTPVSPAQAHEAPTSTRPSVVHKTGKVH
jgi:hypothetical protein